MHFYQCVCAKLILAHGRLQLLLMLMSLKLNNKAEIMTKTTTFYKMLEKNKITVIYCA